MRKCVDGRIIDAGYPLFMRGILPVKAGTAGFFLKLTDMGIWGILGMVKKKATGNINRGFRGLHRICFMRITSFLALGKKDVWIHAL
jgi:hypothetical protein